MDGTLKCNLSLGHVCGCDEDDECEGEAVEHCDNPVRDPYPWSYGIVVKGGYISVGPPYGYATKEGAIQATARWARLNNVTLSNKEL